MASLLVKPPVTGLSIRAPSKIYVGQTVNVQVSMIPPNAEMASVKWKVRVENTEVMVELAAPESSNINFSARINSNGTGTITLLRDLFQAYGTTDITFEATSGSDVYSSVKMKSAQTVTGLTLTLESNDPSFPSDVLQDSVTGVYTVGIGYNVKPVLTVTTSDNQPYTGVINWNILPSESTLVVTSSSRGGTLVSSPAVLGNMEAVKAGSFRLTYTTFDYRNTTAFIDILVVPSPPQVSLAIDQAKSFIYDGNVFVGKTVPVYLCVHPVGATYTNLLWTSSNPAAAFIDSSGNLTGVSVGTYTLTASLTDSTNQQITLTSSVQNVTFGIARIGFNQPSLRNLQIAEETDIGPELLTVTLSSGDPAPDLTKITFSSSDPKIMTISNNSVIQAIANGSANLIARAIDGTEVTASMPVFVETSLDILTLNIPQTMNINASFPVKLVASNTSKSPSYLLEKFWSSSDSSKVSVTQTGVLTGVATGTSVISFMATVSSTSFVTGGNLTVTTDPTNEFNTVKVLYSSTITVTNNVTSILVSPASAAINYLASDKTVTLNANVVPSTAANPNIVWSSSNPAVASIPDSSNQSSVVVTGVSSGTATISATAQDTGKIIGRSVITVGTPILGVTVNHPTSVTVGTPVQVTYSLTPEGALAESVVWSNSKRRLLIDYGDLTDTGLYVPPATLNIPSTGQLQLQSPSLANPNPTNPNPFTLSVKNQFASDPIVVPLNDFTVRQPVTSVGVSEPVVTVSTTGSTNSYEVAPFLLPTNAFNKTVTWSSMDQSVAVVVAPANGPVTVQGVNAGIAIIKATSDDGPVGTLVVNVTAGTVSLVPAVPSISIDSNIPGSITSNSITIRWNAVMNATSYSIVVTEKNSNPLVTVPVSFPAFGLGNDPGIFTITGLNSFTEYVIKMYNSDMSNYQQISSDAKTLSNVPAAPELKVGTVTSTSIQVTWDDNSSATSYSFTVVDNESNVVTVTFPAFSAGQDPGTFTFNITPGPNVFYYTVTIFNSDNSNSNFINVPLSQSPVLGSPSLSMSAVPVSTFTSNSITLHWTPVLYATSYGVYYSTSTPTNTSVLPSSVNPLQNSTYTEVLFTNASDPEAFTIGGSSLPLSSGTYHIWMWSYNSDSTTSNSNSSTTPTYVTIDISQTPPPTQLASPQLNPGTTTDTGFTLYWTPVLNATSYGLYYTTSNPGAQTDSLPTTVDLDNSTTFTPVPFVGSPQTDPGTVTIGSLNSNATYYVWIWSYNSNSTTNPNSSTTPTYVTINIAGPTPPAPASAVEITSITVAPDANNKLVYTVNWNATSDITRIVADAELLSNFAPNSTGDNYASFSNTAYTINLGATTNTDYKSWTNNTSNYSGKFVYSVADPNYTNTRFAEMTNEPIPYNTNVVFMIRGEYTDTTSGMAQLTGLVTSKLPVPQQSVVSMNGPPTAVGFKLEPLSVTASKFIVYLIEQAPVTGILPADQVVSNCDPGLTQLSLYGTVGGSSTGDLLENKTLTEAFAVANGYIESLDLNYNRTITFEDSATISYSYYASAKIVFKNLIPDSVYTVGGQTGSGLTLLKNIYGTINNINLTPAYITTATLNKVAPITITGAVVSGNTANISWRGGNKDAVYKYYLNDAIVSISNDFSNTYNPHVDVDVQISSGPPVSNSIYITAQMFDSQGAAIVDSNGQIIPAVSSNTFTFDS